MAEVYRAYHPNLDRYVAIKVLHSFLSEDAEFKIRFEKEAQNIAKLRHPHIVQVYDFDFDPTSESYYMVMELIEGPTLKDRLYDENTHEGRSLPLPEVLRLTREGAKALAYAHGRGMIHRDVKPANLMLDDKEHNRLVLTDFGIAKLMGGTQNTMSGGMVGTPAYMAPEQGMGETGDERSDLYSLGVIMYQMLTGDLPYDAETPLGIILRHMNDPIPSVRQIDPHLPPAVDKVMQKLMAKEPDERYQSADELIEALEILEKAPARLDPATLVLPKLPIPKPEDKATTKRPEKTGSRFPFALLFLIIGLLVIGGGTYWVGVNNGLFPAPGALLSFLASATPTTTLTPTATDTVAPPTITPTLTLESSPTVTLTNTASLTPTSTASFTPTATLTLTATETLIFTPTPTATATSTPNLTQTWAAERTATTTACTFDYAIIEQTPPDARDNGTFLPVNTPYNRQIRLLNAGSCVWERNTSLTFISGETFKADPRIFIREQVEPAQEVVLIFSGTLPAQGSVDPICGTWELRTPGQIPIGERLEICVFVFDPGN